MFQEAEVYPRTGRELETKNTIEEWLSDTSYVALSNDAIHTLFSYYRSDSTICPAVELYQSCLFSGGIRFDREGKELSPDADRWYNSAWKLWASEVDDYFSVLGWCPCRLLPHSDFIGEPTVLNLSNMMILYKLDVDSKPHFVFFERVAISHNKKEQCGFRYVEHVVVYTTKHKPEADGSIVSNVSVMATDIAFEEGLVQATNEAIQSRAHPVLVLEEVNQKYDNEAIVSTISPLTMQKQTTTEFMGGGGGGDVSSIQLEKKTYEYAKAIGLAGTEGMEQARNYAANYLRASQQYKEHPVPDGKKVANVHLAEAPGDLLSAFRDIRTERIYNLFGIPRGMVSDSSSSSSSGKKTSMNENANIVYITTQKQRKERVLSCIYDMYSRIFKVHHTLQYLTRKRLLVKEEEDNTNSEENENEENKNNNKKPRTTTSDDDDDKGNTDLGMKITLSGTAEDSVLERLYMMGALKYESFVQIMASRYGLSEDSFNPAPEMDLKLLNGIKPEPTSTSTGSGGGGESKKKTTNA